jgi:hypothetical protein
MHPPSVDRNRGVTTGSGRVSPLTPMLSAGSIPILGASSHAPGLKGLSRAVNEIWPVTDGL